ncbi:MAG: DUF5662 family protein [bacterium]|nr:DUF5662 family protein [bacterium]
MKYIKYFSYLLIHKYYVMVECFKEGLYWRGLAHDMSKFLPSELFPYADHFICNIKECNCETGYYKSVDSGDKKFDFAWILHQKRNKHHWQWWVLPDDGGGLRAMEMEEPYLIEMVCDWVGAGKAQGKVSPKDDKYFETRNWYANHKNKMKLNEKTRAKIEEKIKWIS